jgi:hypothetical protein
VTILPFLSVSCRRPQASGQILRMRHRRLVHCTGSVLCANISALEDELMHAASLRSTVVKRRCQGVSKPKEDRQRIRQANRKLAKQQEEIAALRARLAKLEAGYEVEGIEPENIVWVLGWGRTGSTWLSDMMRTLPDHARWNEPVVGRLFGYFYYYDRSWDTRDAFILSDRFRETWLSAIRSLVLDGATARYPEVAEGGGYLVVKDPWGSIGAPLLMEALPESRMIFLVRDPRDVVASILHVTFLRETPSAPRWQKAEEQTDDFVREEAEFYLGSISRTRQAYEAHKGRKALVRYEDLKADTLGTMKRIYSALEIPADEGELAKAVEKRSLENMPEDKKGEGTVRRRGTSGGWREDLTPEQVEIVERTTAPLLEEFYA